MIRLNLTQFPIILSALLITLIGFSCDTAENEDKGFTINGHIEGVADGQAKLSFLELGTNESKTLDSAIIENGKFTFQGTVHSPYQYSISINDSLGTIHLFLENSAINISGKVEDMTKVQISGSREDSLYQSYPIDAVFDKDLGMEIMTKYPDYVYAVFVSYYQFQTNNFDPSKMDSIMSNFDETVKTSTYYEHLNKIYQATKNVNVSKKAPNFSLNDQNDELISLKEIQGKYKIVNFIASEDPYFDYAFPVLHEKFNEKGLTIISISVDGNFTENRESTEGKYKPWVRLRTNTPWGLTTDLYGVKYVPQNFLIDNDGFIIRKNMDYKSLETELEAILDQK